MKKLYEAEVCKFESKELTYDNKFRYKIDKSSEKNIYGTIDGDFFIDVITGEKYPVFKKVGYYTEDLKIELNKYYAWVKEIDERICIVYLMQIRDWLLSRIENSIYKTKNKKRKTKN